MKRVHNHSVNNKFIVGIILNSIFITLEIFYGFQSNSLALLADAAHNAGDVFGLLVAWFGYWIAHKKAPAKFTFGYKNVTVLAAFINSVLLFIAVGGIIFEAVPRLGEGNHTLASTTVMLVAFIGVIINGITAYFFFHDREHDINIQGAFLHMFLDALVSFGVIVAGFFIYWKSWLWLDPVISLVIALVILFSSWRLFKESLNLMLAAVPTSIDIEKLKAAIFKSKGLIGIHDLHIWPISTTETALSVHLVVSPKFFKDSFSRDIEKRIKTKFSISHVTIQMELQNMEQNCETNC
jgi:cobalt-zinc-cadmium efflux system protein